MKTLVKFFIVLSFFIGTAISTHAQVTVGISIRVTPPALPVYTQPYCPGDGYLWIPGYWAYDEDDYYWVPGTWVLPPEDGFLWTPGFWDFSNGYYAWHEGYWGHHVGFYGGVDYGFGYGGIGYCGGEWRGNTFRYNRAVNNVSTTIIHNTYIDRTIVNKTTIKNNNRASFHGQGGVVAKPTQQELLVLRESHVKPTSSQLSHESSARADKSQFVSVNHGHPQKLVEPAIQNHQVLKPQNNHTTNQPNHNVQKSVTINQHPQIQKNNKVENVNWQAHDNAQNQVKQAKVNQKAIRNQQVNANNERRQIQANPQQIKSRQINANNAGRQVQHTPSPMRNQVNVQHQQPQSHNGGIVRGESKGKEHEK
jgi:WXXGXW repeat (2 copies)